MTFEFDGQQYKKASPHQKSWGRTVIDQLELRGDERILDMGCGDGALTARLARRVPDGLVVGIDASQSMIDTAGSEYGARNLRFELMDIDTVDFDCEFDVVFSNATLHWITDHDKLLANVHRALKDGAYLRWQFAADGNCANLIAVLKEVMAESAYATQFAGFNWPWYMPTVEQYRAKLEDRPLQDKKLWATNADRYFADAEEMTAWIDQPSIVPFLQVLDREQKKNFRNAVVERMVERTMAGDGRCFETFRRINVFARK
jgi:trans-aconitate methyltransferase